MTAQHIGSASNAHQHESQQDVVARAAPGQQHGVSGLIGQKAPCGNEKEAQAGAADGSTVPTKAQQMVTRKRHTKRSEPTSHIGQQGRPAGPCHDGSGDAPVDSGGDAAHDHEPSDAAVLACETKSALATSAVHGRHQHSSWRCISVCLDDFGLHEGINAAALALARQGRVQAISAMVGGHAWSQGARALQALDTNSVEVGLHLDLTECTFNPALRQPLWRVIVQAYLHRLNVGTLRTEIDAQLDAFERAMGRPPAYVDGHQHVHQLPVVRDALVQVLARRYPAHAPWLRATHSPNWGAHVDTFSDLKSRVIAMLGARALSRLSRQKGLQQNGRLLGVYGFAGGAQRYRDRLERWLRFARDGDLLICHVGVPDRTPDALAQARQSEFAVLDSADFEALLADAHVRLLPMGRCRSNLTGLPQGIG